MVLGGPGRARRIAGGAGLGEDDETKSLKKKSKKSFTDMGGALDTAFEKAKETFEVALQGLQRTEIGFELGTSMEFTFYMTGNSGQGLTLVPFSAQHAQFLWDDLGGTYTRAPAPLTDWCKKWADFLGRNWTKLVI